MNTLNFTALLPLIVLASGSVFLMLQIAFFRHSNTSWRLCCLSLLVSALAVIPATTATGQVSPLLHIDRLALLFTAVVALGALLTALLSRDYMQSRAVEQEEFYLLLLLASAGAVVLVAASHLASFLLGLELLGVSLYALIAYPERSELALEAAIKYLVLSGAASAVLLFGFALLYAALGTLSFAAIGELAGWLPPAPLLIASGAAMAFAGMAFKLSLAPFHMWTPDVYQGAPTPVSGFLAGIAKGTVFVAVVRLFLDAGLYRYPALLNGITILAVISMLVGNLLALQQDNLKRLLAYSSIAHFGYLLVALILFSGDRALALEAVGYYLIAYAVTVLAAFTAISLLSGDAVEREWLEDTRGLLWRRPLLALLLIAALLSLAGIPLTAGFIAKFYIIAVGVAEQAWLLLGALLVGSALGIYYYLRCVFIIVQQAGDNAAPPPALSSAALLVAMLLLGAVLWLGVFPQELMTFLSGVRS